MRVVVKRDQTAKCHTNLSHGILSVVVKCYKMANNAINKVSGWCFVWNIWYSTYQCL